MTFSNYFPREWPSFCEITYIEEGVSPKPDFLEKALVNILIRQEVQKVVEVLLVPGLALLAPDRMPHEQTLIERTLVHLITKGLIVRGQLQVANLATVLVVHQRAVLDFPRRRPADPIAQIGVNVAGLARVDRVVEVAVENLGGSVPRDPRALAVVGEVVGCG